MMFENPFTSSPAGVEICWVTGYCPVDFLGLFNKTLCWVEQRGLTSFPQGAGGKIEACWWSELRSGLTALCQQYKS